ncbi:MAG: hypothetical protein PUG54_06745 [Firmicutes bacterium]|nr:hypothetical protein [Bacillota bacterium]
MEKEKKRITITIPLDQEAELEELRNEKFKDKSNSELLRTLMREGLEVSDKQELETKNIR